MDRSPSTSPTSDEQGDELLAPPSSRNANHHDDDATTLRTNNYALDIHQDYKNGAEAQEETSTTTSQSANMFRRRRQENQGTPTSLTSEARENWKERQLRLQDAQRRACEAHSTPIHHNEEEEESDERVSFLQQVKERERAERLAASTPRNVSASEDPISFL